MTCKPEATHYHGCDCHEARRDAELAEKDRLLTLAMEQAISKVDRSDVTKGLLTAIKAIIAAREGCKP